MLVHEFVKGEEFSLKDYQSIERMVPELVEGVKNNSLYAALLASEEAA